LNSQKLERSLFIITVGLKGGNWPLCFADGDSEESGKMRNIDMMTAWSFCGIVN
jgi:hypothetical protein